MFKIKRYKLNKLIIKLKIYKLMKNKLDLDFKCIKNLIVGLKLNKETLNLLLIICFKNYVIIIYKYYLNFNFNLFKVLI